ncbi:MAG: pyruvate dehydrogenase (acetyl-transferring) E1 component subunit alpha [Candidatus Riflebacteria bacterium]|nr:pyruvate dehydrogenase (acetyl-transferring) E1 component subunit alpha [Candidatus Riflebacteria bacterium]
MPRTVIQESRTERLEILDMEGRLDEALAPALSDDQLVTLYRLMVRMRKFDEKALNLQRQGRIGTYGSIKGQEACQAGLVPALTRHDWLVPSFREHGVLISSGIPMHLVYALWKGDERSNLFPEGIRCLPPSIPVGSQLLHAAGLGMGLAKKGDPGVAVGFGGDGATSEGDFHEALNFAGVFSARTLFFIQNNQWAISVPLKRQTASETIAQKAHAYGFPGIQVDGNDVLAVTSASQEALAHVRAGRGPYLIECLTYRMENHTTADDQSRYRTPEEVAYWASRDPIDRMRKFLSGRGLWGEELEKSWALEVSTEVDREVELLETMPAAPATDILDYMYGERPWFLEEQRRLLQEEAES